MLSSADLFERRYGFWRSILDGVVARYLDCGILERGFARIRCPDCATEFLLGFSCKGRGLCPSWGAKRAAEFAALLQDEVAVVQTFGDQLNLHPHVHALVTRGGWTASGERVSVPYVDPSSAERFRHKVIHPPALPRPIGSLALLRARIKIPILLLYCAASR